MVKYQILSTNLNNITHNVFYPHNKHFIEYCYLLPIDSGGVECDFASARVNTFHLQSKCAFEKNGHMIHKHHLYQRCKDICDLYIR